MYIGNLTQLNVYRTEIGNNELKLIITNNQSLKCLNIGACSNIIGDDICNCLSLHCKQLLAVDFWRCQSLTARGVLTLASITSLEVYVVIQTGIKIGFGYHFSGSGRVRVTILRVFIGYVIIIELTLLSFLSLGRVISHWVSGYFQVHNIIQIYII